MKLTVIPMSRTKMERLLFTWPAGENCFNMPFLGKEYAYSVYHVLLVYVGFNTSV